MSQSIRYASIDVNLTFPYCHHIHIIILSLCKEKWKCQEEVDKLVLLRDLIRFYLINTPLPDQDNKHTKVCVKWLIMLKPRNLDYNTCGDLIDI